MNEDKCSENACDAKERFTHTHAHTVRKDAT